MFYLTLKVKIPAMMTLTQLLVYFYRFFQAETEVTIIQQSKLSL